MQSKIEKLIRDYSKIYRCFEKYQKDSLLAGGDQKTGVIGEYYAKKYIEDNIKDYKDLKYAKNGEPCDIKYEIGKKEVKIQVKTVSYYSKTRTIAPLNMTEGAFDFLYLISLDENFKPNAFFINTFEEIENMLNKTTRTKIKGTKMKGKLFLGNNCKGSRIYNFEKNLIE